MPTITLIKDTDLQGRISYFVRKDGVFVSGSVTSDRKTADKILDNVIRGLKTGEKVIAKIEF